MSRRRRPRLRCPCDAWRRPAGRAEHVGPTSCARRPQRLRRQCSRSRKGWLQTAARQLAHAAGDTLPTEDGGRAQTVAGWLAGVQHSTAGSAGAQLRTARLLQRLPLVTAAVLEGILTPAQAAVLTRFVGKIDEQALLESQPHLVEVAAAMDPAQLGVGVAHQLATHCEPAFDEQQARAHRCFLTSRRDADGSLRGSFLLPAEDSEAFLSALEPLARRNTVRDERTAGQRRADALVEVCEQVLRHGHLPDAGGLRPRLSYVLPADWGAAQQRQAACTDCGPRCDDHQPVPFADTVTAALRGYGGIRADQACATAAGPDRSPAPASRRCSATPGSPGCCSPRSVRSVASNRCATPSHPRSAATSRRVT